MSAQEGRKLLAEATKGTGYIQSESPFEFWLLDRADALLDLWEAAQEVVDQASGPERYTMNLTWIEERLRGALSRLEGS